MIIEDLLYELESSKINVKIIEDRIDLEAPKGVITEYIIDLVKENKQTILNYFYANNSNNYKSIEPAIIKGYYSLSSAQKRLYILQQMDLLSTTYNMAQMVPIENITKNTLEDAIRKLISRHESLRTSFEIVNDEPIQKIYEDVPFEVQYFEIANSSEKDNIYKEFIKPFKLNEAPLLRCGLIKTSDNNCFLLADMHHIISDGVSMELLRSDLNQVLNNETIEPLRLQYKDYSEWQNSPEQREKMKKQEEFWLKSFADEIPVLNLPYDYPRPATQSFEGATINFFLNKQISDNLQEFAKQTNSTLSITLLAIFNILLSKLTGQEDIIVGLPIAGRKHSDLEKIIGMFVNTLALRNYPKKELTFKEFLLNIKDNTLLAYENQEYQFEDLVEKVGVTRNFSRNPLFDVCFNMLNMGILAENTPTFDQPNTHIKSVSKFDLSLTAVEIDNNININFEYCTKLFKAETIDRFIEYFLKITAEIALNKKLSDVEIITDTEKKLILGNFNITKTFFQNNKTINQLFEEQVERTPDNIALVFQHKEMTFRELNNRANQLAVLLRNKGIGPDNVIGLMIDRSFEMLIGILGILKSGGAYLPIDLEYPDKRKAFMLKDSNAKVLLSRKNVYKQFGYEGEIFLLDEIEQNHSATENLPIVNNPNNLVYVIYTSGTTGKPKGVMLEHRSVINTLEYLHRLYPLNQNDSYLLKTSYCFDVSVSEIFANLFNGGRIVILEPGLEKDPYQILNTINEYQITHLNFVPSMFNMFIQSIKEKNKIALAPLKYVFVAGEAFPQSMASAFNDHNDCIKQVNLYGPTEAAIYASGYSLTNIKKINSVPIGKPIDNANLFIVSNTFQLQPIGVAGELLIGGIGLARGYLNRDDLTKEKFIYWDPKTGERYNVNDKTGTTIRVYRTGDLCRWLPDGNIEFLGRIDHQVKIRGFRIELGEIENQLLSNENIKEAVVIAKDNQLGQKSLVAYIVTKSKIEISDLRAELSKSLTDYMIPSYFVELEKIPLNSNGKIDRRALPDPQIKVKDYVAPRNEIEEKLVEIWSEVLQIDKNKISINSNFFELGGNSLLIIKAVQKINNKVSVELNVIDMFRHTTISGLTAYINGASLFDITSTDRIEEINKGKASMKKLLRKT